MAIERQKELRRRRRRRAKVRLLRARLSQTTDKSERQRLLEKLLRVSEAPPDRLIEEFQKGAPKKRSS